MRHRGLAAASPAGAADASAGTATSSGPAVAAGSGSHTRKQVPSPGVLSTVMRPRISAASSWQIARPSPLPLPAPAPVDGRAAPTASPSASVSARPCTVENPMADSRTPPEVDRVAASRRAVAARRERAAIKSREAAELKHLATFGLIRARRIARTVEELQEGKKRPCCWAGWRARRRAGRGGW